MPRARKRSGQGLVFPPWRDIIAWLRHLEVSSAALTWRRFSGALALVLVVLLFVTGAGMTLYYSPVPGAAYDSVDYIQFSVPFGHLLRGIHYYAWNLLLVVMVLHLGRTFILGAYKAPQQMVWVSGVLVLLSVPACIITGDLLPWNQQGYWSTQVRLSIISSVPVVGDFVVRMVRGSLHTGIVTLTRFYVLHTIFLPCLFLVLLAVHGHYIGQRRRPEEVDERSTIPFLPHMVNRWLGLFLVITVALGLVVWQRPVPLGDPADPTDTSYVPKPEWWVLFLNQLVMIFRGPLMLCGTLLIPGALVGLLIALPFLDRSPERRLTHRKKTLLIAVVIVIMLLGLSVMGFIAHYM